MKKKLLRFLVYWCIPGLLLLPIGGCFTAMSRFMGSSPGPVAVVVARTLDVVTMPVQIVVAIPMIAMDYIESNTGEAGRERHEAEQRERYEKILDKDFSQVFQVREFLSVTSTPARVALHDWLGAYGIHHPRRDQIDALAEWLLSNSDVAIALTPIFHQQHLSDDLRKKLCVSLVGFSRTCDARECSRIMHYADKFLSDDEIKGLVSKADDETDKSLSMILQEREKRREEKRRREAERAAQLQKEKEERWERQRAENLARSQRRAELRQLAGNIDGTYEEFEKSLAVRGESVVASFWQSRLHNVAKPLPSENVRKLAEVLTGPGEPMNRCCPALFRRPELTPADLRNLYSRVLKKLAEKDGWQSDGCLYAGSLIKNVHFPSDLAQASYNEPLLVELRITYLIHHHEMLGNALDTLYAFEQACDGLKRDCRNGKISIEKRNAKLFMLTQRHLPEKCPDDWVRSIP